MKSKILVLACVVLIGALAPAARGASTPGDFGSQVQGSAASRTITIMDSTRYVNVDRFETVRFVIRDATGRESGFAWHFNTFGGRVFQLSEIAPAGFLGERDIRVYVARQPPED